MLWSAQKRAENTTELELQELVNREIGVSLQRLSLTLPFCSRDRDKPTTSHTLRPLYCMHAPISLPGRHLGAFSSSSCSCILSPKIPIPFSEGSTDCILRSLQQIPDSRSLLLHSLSDDAREFGSCDTHRDRDDGGAAAPPEGDGEPAVTSYTGVSLCVPLESVSQRNRGLGFLSVDVDSSLVYCFT